MKKLLFIILLLAGSTSFSQSLDLHYDFERECLTTTMEMFRPDKLGNTFFFIDMNYGEGDVEGISNAYWEIARVFNINKFPIGINLEYNGGFGRFYTDEGDKAFGINNAWLIGPVYSKNAKDYSKGFTVKALYKGIQGADVGFGYQFTGVWYLHFLNKKMTFKGFADLWRQDSDFNFDGTVDAEHVFLAEPQIWYHIHKHFDVGGEVELSNNFGNTEGFKTRPTIAVKWIF